MNQFSKSYNLEERTAKLGENIIKFCRSVKGDYVVNPIINQVIRAVTGIGANYCEANNASSKKDFRNKIYICKKEAQESKYWLRMLLTALPGQEDEIKILLSEVQELILIFQKICNTLNQGKSSSEIEN